MTDFDDNEAVHSSGALYLLGALDAAQETAFERHLALCRACQRECDEIGPLASGLSRLPDDEVAALLGDGLADSSGRLRPEAVRRDRSGPPRSVDAPGVRRDRSGRRGRRFRLAVGGFAALLAVVLGTAVWTNLRSAPPTRVTPVDSSITVEGTGASARLVVVVVQRAHTTTLVATVTGLEQSVGYRLYAVMVDGQAHEVAKWVGVPEPTDLTAQLAEPLTDLSFFSVTRSDGTAVVIARMSRGR
jgi:anti-sigma factor RsiW